MEGEWRNGKHWTEVVHYVDGCNSTTHYSPEEDIIVLDSNLKNYPLAHKYALKHEVLHRKIGDNFFKQLIHEWTNDVYTALGRDETVQQLREYHSENQSYRSYYSVYPVNYLRTLYYPLIKFFSWLNRKLDRLGF